MAFDLPISRTVVAITTVIILAAVISGSISFLKENRDHVYMAIADKIKSDFERMQHLSPDGVYIMPEGNYVVDIYGHKIVLRWDGGHVEKTLHTTVITFPYYGRPYEDAVKNIASILGPLRARGGERLYVSVNHQYLSILKYAASEYCPSITWRDTQDMDEMMVIIPHAEGRITPWGVVITPSRYAIIMPLIVWHGQLPDTLATLPEKRTVEFTDHCRIVILSHTVKTPRGVERLNFAFVYP